jgi:hypothetical protein
VLCIDMVFLPPMNISEVYSSIALLLSPTYGTYCKFHRILLSSRHYSWIWNSWSTKQSIMCTLQNKLSELAKSNAFNKLREERLPW